MSAFFLVFVVARLALLGQCTEGEDYPATFPRPAAYVVHADCALPALAGLGGST